LLKVLFRHTHQHRIKRLYWVWQEMRSVTASSCGTLKISGKYEWYPQWWREAGAQQDAPLSLQINEEQEVDPLLVTMGSTLVTSEKATSETPSLPRALRLPRALGVCHPCHKTRTRLQIRSFVPQQFPSIAGGGTQRTCHKPFSPMHSLVGGVGWR